MDRFIFAADLIGYALVGVSFSDATLIGDYLNKSCKLIYEGFAVVSSLDICAII